MSGTAVSFSAVIVPVMLFMLSGVALANTYESRKSKFKAFFFLLMTVALFGGGYYMLTTGKTAGNLRSNASARYANWQAARAAKLGPTANVPPPAGAPPPLGAPM